MGPGAPDLDEWWFKVIQGREELENCIGLQSKSTSPRPLRVVAQLVCAHAGIKHGSSVCNLEVEEWSA